jgi:hypothetical protein
MWTRLSPATTIPTKLQLFTSRGAPVVLLEGKYASEPGEGIPFTVFNQFGRCLTNGIYPATLAPSQARTNATAWRLEGESLQLLDAEGHVALVVTLLDGPQK